MKTLFASVVLLSVGTLFAAVCLIAPPAVYAQATKTWDGGGASGNWSDGFNWSNDTAPADGGTWEIYEFDGGDQLNSNNDIVAGLGGWNVNGISFLLGAGTFTLTDNGQGFDMLGAENVGATDGPANIVNNSANTQTISARLIHRTNFNTGLVFNTATDDIDVTSVISQEGAGSDTVRKTGLETLTLTGANTYTNDTVVNAGVLALTGTGSLDSDIIVNSGGTLRLASATDSIDDGADITLNGTGALDLRENENINSLSGNGVLSSGIAGTRFLGIGNSGGSSTFSGLIEDGSGTVEIDKLSTGTLTLNGNNTYDGLTEVMAGVLNIQSNTALGSTTGSTQVNNDAALHLQGGITVTGEALSITGDGIPSAEGALRNISGNNIWTGNITATGSPTFVRIVSDADKLTISGNISVTAGDVLVLQGDGNGEVSGDINSTSGLIKSNTGTGTWILSGTNTYTTTTISNGTLQIGNGGTTGTLGSGAVTNNSALVFDRNNALAVANAISGSGSVEQAGSGTLTLSNDTNSYTGTTTVSDGVLRVTAGGALGTTAAGTTVTNGAALQVENNITVTGEALTIAGQGISNTGALRNVSGNNTFTGAITMQSGVQSRIHSDAGLLTLTGGISSTGNSLILSGAGDGEETGTISGVFQVLKQGNGTWTLSGNNNYTTPTNVQAGTLALSSSTSNNNIASSPTITVASGATLDVTGITALGGFQVVSGQTLAGEGTVVGATTILGDLSPNGTSVGTLSFDDNLDVSGAADLLFDLGGTGDLVDLTNASNPTLTIGPLFGVSDFDFDTESGFGPGTYTLFDTNTSITGTLGDTNHIFSPGVLGILSFANGTDDLILSVTIIPEPSTMVLGILGLLGLSLCGRRRRRCRR